MFFEALLFYLGLFPGSDLLFVCVDLPLLPGCGPLIDVLTTISLLTSPGCSEYTEVSVLVFHNSAVISFMLILCQVCVSGNTVSNPNLAADNSGPPAQTTKIRLRDGIADL